jgi:hypothetical protein
MVKSALSLVKSNLSRYAFVAFGALLLLGALTVPASAQSGTTVTYGLGQNGAPAATDYYNAANGFSSSIGPILTAILPVLLLMLAIWNGPRIIKGLVTKFSRG